MIEEAIVEQVEQICKQRHAEVIMILSEKLERKKINNVQSLLDRYVSLKLKFHHLKKKYYDTDGDYYKKYITLNNEVKEARREYYAAKYDNDS